MDQNKILIAAGEFYGDIRKTVLAAHAHAVGGRVVVDATAGLIRCIGSSLWGVTGRLGSEIDPEDPEGAALLSAFKLFGVHNPESPVMQGDGVFLREAGAFFDEVSVIVRSEYSKDLETQAEELRDPLRMLVLNGLCSALRKVFLTLDTVPDRDDADGKLLGKAMEYYLPKFSRPSNK